MTHIDIENQNKSEIKKIIEKEFHSNFLLNLNNIFKNGFKNKNLKVQNLNQDFQELKMSFLNLEYIEKNISICIEYHHTKSYKVHSLRNLQIYFLNGEEKIRFLNIFSDINYESNAKSTHLNVFDLYDEILEIKSNKEDFLEFVESKIKKLPISKNAQESICMLFFNITELSANYDFENLNEGYIKVNKDFLNIKKIVDDNFYIPNLLDKKKSLNRKNK